MKPNALDAIREKLKALDDKTSTTNRPGSGDNTLFPHWNINENETATIRFLPDDNLDNTFFWVERQMIKLPFPGVIGQESRPVTVQVPCGEMYGDACPILAEVRPWFKEPTLEDLGRKYWKKRSYIFQGFVVKNPIQEEAPENPIRRFVISPQIFNIIKAALMDPDMEHIPTDYVNGTDFSITKITKGSYADYGTSKWARKERALSEEELAAIDQHGLFNLSTFLPDRPSAEHYKAMHEMFEASVNGELYDPSRWGNFYKPYGIEVPAGATQSGSYSKPAPAPKATPAPVDDDNDIPFDMTPGPQTHIVESKPVQEEATPTDSAPKKSAEDILAMIRNRNSA